MSENQTPGQETTKKASPRRADLPTTDLAAALAAAEHDDEPAFDWMKTAAAPGSSPDATDAVPGASPAGEGHAVPDAGLSPEPDATPGNAPQVPSSSDTGVVAAAPAAETQPGAGSPAGAKPVESAAYGRPNSPIKLETAIDGTAEPMRPARNLPPKLALDPAHDDFGAKPASGAEASNGSAVFNEPLPTSMLQIRPPQEEVDARSAERDQAAAAKPVLPRVMQVLLAVFYPVVLLVGAIRLVTTPLFLWVEYHRPGFPADSFGFSTDDRMTYGSYTVDYLLNFAGPRYLGDLVNVAGKPLFAAGEVSHMADVKSVITMAFSVGTILAIGMLIAVIYLLRRSTGGVRRGLFAGSLATLVLVIGLGVLAFMGWETFFTDFHQIFFKEGTWTFYLDDTLIRLFPSEFWMDAGLLIGVVVFVVSTLTMALTWPTKSRRNASSRSSRPGRRAAATA